MPSPRICAVARRIILEELHVADQGGPRVTTLEEVVAENPVLWKFSAHRLFKGVHVVNALADE
jgi:hypothetical protein